MYLTFKDVIGSFELTDHIVATTGASNGTGKSLVGTPPNVDAKVALSVLLLQCSLLK